MNNLKTAFSLLLIVFFAFFVRIYKVADNPPGLYWDEVALGYDAYLILTTGRDQHGKIPLTYLTSFGDYKNPLYVYCLVPLLKIFGPTNFTVRLPAVLAGVLTVISIFFLVKRIVPKPDNEKIALLSAFLLAINPWHIHFSRVAFEANLYVFILTASITSLYYALTNLLYLPLGFLFIGLLPYSYHSGKLMVPFVILSALTLILKNRILILMLILSIEI